MGENVGCHILRRSSTVAIEIEPLNAGACVSPLLLETVPFTIRVYSSYQHALIAKAV